MSSEPTKFPWMAEALKFIEQEYKTATLPSNKAENAAPTSVSPTSVSPTSVTPTSISPLPCAVTSVLSIPSSAEGNKQHTNAIAMDHSKETTTPGSFPAPTRSSSADISYADKGTQYEPPPANAPAARSRPEGPTAALRPRQPHERGERITTTSQPWRWGDRRAAATPRVHMENPGMTPGERGLACSRWASGGARRPTGT